MNRNTKIGIAIAAALAVVVVLALVLAGCGKDDNGPAPASVVPADASLYAEAVVHPEGDQADAATDLLSTVLATNDPGQKIVDELDKALKESPGGASYEEDIEPWLGDEVGVFTIGFDDDPPAAAVAQASDADLGVERIRASSEITGHGTYEGISYELDENGSAFAAVDGFVVYGELPAFKAAVDASKGDPLAGSERYDDAVADLPDDAIAIGYINLDGLLDEVADSQGDVGSIVFDKFTDQLGVNHAIAVSLTADSDSAQVEVPAVSIGGTPLLGEVPSDAVVAVGVSDLGDKADKLIKAIEESGVSGVFSGAVQLAVQVETGIDLEELLPTIGDAAVFVTGTTEDNLGGALMLETKDEAVAGDTIDSLRDYFADDEDDNASVRPLRINGGGNGFAVTTPGTSEPINVVENGDLIVIGYGNAATESALDPSQTLADTPGFQDAGDDIDTKDASLYASIPAIATLIASSSGNDADYIRPYLERLGALIGAASDDGFKIQLSVK